MSDIALMPDAAGFYDIALEDGDIVQDFGLKTAVLLSLNLNARADNAQGFWADAADDSGHITGSLLWQLSREKTTQAVLNSAKDYAESALQWLLDDRVASAVSVQAQRDANDYLVLIINITHGQGKRWQAAWQAEFPYLKEL